MAKESQQSLSAIICMGTTPHNDDSCFGPRKKEGKPHWEIELDQRISLTQEAIRDTNPKFIVFVGGEGLMENGVVSTEAESARDHFIDKQYHKPNMSPPTPKILLAQNELETVSQIEETIKILTENDLTHGLLGIITSWHQMPRIQLIFSVKSNFTTKAYVANKPELNTYLITNMWNCLAGLGYTSLLLFIQKLGFWKNGGPVIEWYKRKRANRV
jgi:hypothetical protein